MSTGPQPYDERDGRGERDGEHLGHGERDGLRHGDGERDSSRSHSGPSGHDDRDGHRADDAHPDGSSAGLDLQGMDEDALRRLLQDSVRDIEPSPEALEHIRKAVPARRARRRNVLVGAAAAVLTCGVAVPTMLHADMGLGGDRPMYNAGHAQRHSPEGEPSTSGDTGDGLAGPDRTAQGPAGASDGGAEAGRPTTGSSAGPNPSSSLGPVSPTCTREQLGSAAGTQQAPDAQGRIYGRFRVVNTSEASCTVRGDGIVLATAQGGAKSTMIQVVDHTTGDQATGLPDPVNAVDEVVLEPGGAYVVRFAWIPREGGGTSGCSTSSPSPGTGGGEGGDGTRASGGTEPMGTSGSLADSGDGGGSGTAGAGGGEGGDGTQASGGDSGTDGSASGGSGTGGTDSGGSGSGGGSGGGTGDGPAPPSVLLTHTPEVGEPAAGEVLLQGACAGTVYRTGVLPAA